MGQISEPGVKLTRHGLRWIQLVRGEHKDEPTRRKHVPDPADVKPADLGNLLGCQHPTRDCNYRAYVSSDLLVCLHDGADDLQQEAGDEEAKDEEVKHCVHLHLQPARADCRCVPRP